MGDNCLIFEFEPFQDSLFIFQGLTNFFQTLNSESFEQSRNSCAGQLRQFLTQCFFPKAIVGKLKGHLQGIESPCLSMMRLNLM